MLRLLLTSAQLGDELAQQPAFGFHFSGVAHRQRHRCQQGELLADGNIIGIEDRLAFPPRQDHQAAALAHAERQVERGARGGDQIARQIPPSIQFMDGAGGRHRIRSSPGTLGCRPADPDHVVRDGRDAVDDVFVRFRQHHRPLEGEHVLQGLEDDREWIVGMPGQQQCFQGTKQQLGVARLRL